MKKVTIISGAAGMTGCATAEKLLARGEWVVGFDNFFAGSRADVERLAGQPRFTFFEYDLTRAADMDALFAFVRREFPAADSRLAFLNCAAVVHTKHFYHPDDTFGVNVVGMRDSLERAIAAGCRTYVNCSTSEVYSMKSWEEGGVREESPVLVATAEQSLRTSYATGKLLTEFFLRDAVGRGRIRGCSIRFANVYSPTEAHESHIIPYAISALLRTGGLTLLENARGTQRSFLHNSDSCAAVVRLLDTDAALDGTIYNVGTPDEIGIVELVELIAKLLGLPRADIRFEGVRTADPARRLLNTAKIRAATGWQPEIPLAEGLRQCIAFWRQGAKGGTA